MHGKYMKKIIIKKFVNIVRINFGLNAVEITMQVLPL